MDITINGKPTIIEESITLSELIALKSVIQEGIAVALNDIVIPKSQWETVQIKSGDKILIITATAGG